MSQCEKRLDGILWGLEAMGAPSESGMAKVLSDDIIHQTN